MDFDLSWVLWGLPIAFVLGWVASRLDLRQLRIENRQAPKAYFRGLNFLLNEQQDQAIDAFIEAVQNDPDTSELHFALGKVVRCLVAGQAIFVQAAGFGAGIKNRHLVPLARQCVCTGQTGRPLIQVHLTCR